MSNAVKPLVYLVALGSWGCAAHESPPAGSAPRAASPTEARPAKAPGAPQRREPADEAASFADVPAALDALAAGLASDDPKATRAATVWLARQGPVAVEPVGEMVRRDDRDLKFRLACLNVLGYLGPAAAPAILQASEDPSPQLRAKAADLLGGIDPPSQPIIRRLIALLDDPDDALRRSAIESLGRIGKPAQQAAPKLQAILNSDANDSLRGAAKTALLKVDPRVGLRQN